MKTKTGAPHAILAAKIAAWQAVAVALITTLGGALVGAALRQGNEQPQRWLTITSLKPLGTGGSVHNLRLIASVNNVAVAYPVNSPWLQLDRGEAPSAKFPIPATDTVLRINFSGYGEDTTGDVMHLCGWGPPDEVAQQFSDQQERFK